MDLPRKQLAELKALYLLEPSLRDVFVEGPFDRSIIRWFVSCKKFENVSVLEIGMVEIPDGEVLASGRKANNRDRLIFLAAYAEVVLGSDQKQVTCVIDSDLALIFNTLPATRSLLSTDYSCMEMYFFNVPTLQKFFTVYCNKFDWPVESIMTSVASVLQELYLVRLTNEDLGWEMAFFDGIPCVSVREWSILIDKDDFMRRYLNKNSRMADIELFSGRLNAMRARLTGEVRNQMHGHDFLDLLCLLMREKGVRGILANGQVVSRVLAMCLQFEDLERTRLFSAIAYRVTA